MNDFCNCGCGFNPGSDYNAFGDIGYNLPLIYEVYCKTIQEVNGTDPDTQDKNNKIYVKNGVLYLPNSYHASFKSPDILMIYDETVTYKDSTLGLVND